MNMLPLAVDTLPRGGVLTVAFQEEADGLRILVMAEGEGARVSDECERAMSPEVSLDELTARSVHAYFVTCLARKLRSNIEVGDDSPRRITFSARLTR
jgi:histidine phosphotransferase ChpT